ncbi:hypothetical protein JHW43_006604, partial [Diplocarpon mali]
RSSKERPGAGCIWNTSGARHTPESRRLGQLYPHHNPEQALLALLAMNRYARGPTIGGLSKATASTLCQNYECKAVVQERPYVSRPSRTQQLLNPKLLPKLASDVSQDLLRNSIHIDFLLTYFLSRKGIADDLLAKADQERGRKRERQSEDPELPAASKRVRSTSATSASVCSISTGMSRSPSPRPARKSARRSDSPPPRRTSPSRSGLAPSSRIAEFEKKRRRESFSSVESYSSGERQQSRDRANTRRRYQKSSPPARGRTTESRSPHRKRQDLSRDRQRARNLIKGTENRPLPPRERSLSPFSKRLALTQAMNGGGR